MKNIARNIVILALAASAMTGCRKYLDVNSDPASPQSPDLPALLPPVTASMARSMGISPQVGQYIQNWSHTAAGEVYDVHGGNAGGSGANQLWRDFYTVQGTAINLIVEKGIQQEAWDYVGVALAVRAWGLQQTTNYFGEMPYKQAWEPNRVYFEYDDQEYLYFAVDSICRRALTFLARTDGKVNQAVLGRGDQVYAGDRARWSKFVYGVMARNFHHLTNKGDYSADSVIKYVDLSMASNTDNFYIVHSATRNDDSNPLGSARDNLSVRRQSRFTVQLLDGNFFYGNSSRSSRDPRLSRMLSASPDTSTLDGSMPALNGGYRFIAPTAGDPNAAAAAGSAAFRRRPSTLWGDSAIINPGIGNFTQRVGKYLFQNSARYPIMTYHEMQFIKAEAAFRKGQRDLALTAYRNGISGHMNFVNFINSGANGVTSITATEINNYLASPAVKQVAGTLTMTDIMIQKYIGDFGWNFVESWCDLRRFHYFDADQETGLPVYRGFTIPLFSSNNLGPKPAYRFRPTNFSEFDWNQEALRKIGALNVDYHTYEMWFSQP
jgi:hypothetical protein